MNKVLFSSNSDDWETPQDLFDSLDSYFHFTLDACASSHNAKCTKYFTKDDNALIQDWSRNVVWCNPPYGKDLYSWVEKCFSESFKPFTTVVMLIPSRTDTRYFQDIILPHASDIWFIRGRLKFNNSKNSAPFPSAVVVFK